MNQSQPTLIRIYDIGESLKLKFTLATGAPGTKDKVHVELLAQPANHFLPHAILDDDLFEAAIHQFEIDRMEFLKKHHPHRYKAMTQ
jgi:hypothetical protein